eukprot:TCONS_00047455-protein
MTYKSVHTHLLCLTFEVMQTAFSLSFLIILYFLMRVQLSFFSKNCPRKKVNYIPSRIRLLIILIIHIHKNFQIFIRPPTLYSKNKSNGVIQTIHSPFSPFSPLHCTYTIRVPLETPKKLSLNE